MTTSKEGVKGPLVVRNLRQLTAELVADAFKIGLNFEEVHERYRPPTRFVNRLEVAKENWRRAPVCEAPERCLTVERFAGERFGFVRGMAGERTQRLGCGKALYNRLKRSGEIQAPVPEKKIKISPNHKVNRPVYYGHCYHCGAGDHSKEKCQDKRKCSYPLCYSEDRKHHVRVCDALHTICGLCRLRGHNPRDHRHFDTLSLLRIATLWSPGGLYTSLPLLAGDRSFWRQPKEEEYYYNVFNRSEKHKVHEKAAGV